MGSSAGWFISDIEMRLNCHVFHGWRDAKTGALGYSRCRYWSLQDALGVSLRRASQAHWLSINQAGISRLAYESEVLPHVLGMPVQIVLPHLHSPHNNPGK